MSDTKKIENILTKYPDKRSAMIPLLWEEQNEHGWIMPKSVEDVAALTGASLAEVWEVVTFYTMFKRKPSGKYLICLCNNLSCSLCNADLLVKHLEKSLGIKDGETTEDGIFTLTTVECLGACADAPAMLVNDDLHVLLTPQKIDEIIGKYRKL